MTHELRHARRGKIAIVVALSPNFGLYHATVKAARNQGLRVFEPPDNKKTTLIFLNESGPGNFPFVLPQDVEYGSLLTPQIQAQRELWQEADGTMCRVTVADQFGELAKTLNEQLIREEARNEGVLARCVDTKCLVVIEGRAILASDDLLLSHSRATIYSMAIGNRFVSISKQVLEDRCEFGSFRRGDKANLDELHKELKLRRDQKPIDLSTPAVRPETPAETRVTHTTTQPVNVVEVLATDSATPSGAIPSQQKELSRPMPSRRFSTKDRPSRNDRLFHKPNLPADPDSIGNR